MGRVCRAWLLAVAANLNASGKLTMQEPEWASGAGGAGGAGVDEQQALACIGSLFRQYKGETCAAAPLLSEESLVLTQTVLAVRYWYWELVEMIRKLLLASVIPMLIGSENQVPRLPHAISVLRYMMVV